ncbi:uncharacterized protein PF3D7_1120000-like [Trachinotus anak]|uniref:uncharacterized protein PF3D7_1120000-like n=1 Tax=Trachinotus anak TaxID=443729 RepID=UPI0039F262F7
MAAAAAFYSSRAVAGVTTTKGLFLIFSLLGLVCFARSLDKEKLEEIKEELEEIQYELDKLKAEHKSNVAITSELIRSMEQNVTLLETEMKELVPEFPHLKTYLEDMRRYIKQTKAYTYRKYEEHDAEMEARERKLRKIKNLVKFLEENEAEL